MGCTRLTFDSETASLHLWVSRLTVSTFIVTFSWIKYRKEMWTNIDHWDYFMSYKTINYLNQQEPSNCAFKLRLYQIEIIDKQGFVLQQAVNYVNIDGKQQLTTQQSRHSLQKLSSSVVIDSNPLLPPECALKLLAICGNNSHSCCTIFITGIDIK